MKLLNVNDKGVVMEGERKRKSWVGRVGGGKVDDLILFEAGG